MAKTPKYTIPVVRTVLVRERKASVANVGDGPMADSTCLAAVAAAVIGPTDREHFLLIALNNAMRVDSVQVMSIGGEASASLSPSALFRAALATGCTNFAVAHNHPSGDVRASPEDRAMTDAIERGMKVLGLNLVDHIIIGRDGAHLSFYNVGYL